MLITGGIRDAARAPAQPSCDSDNVSSARAAVWFCLTDGIVDMMQRQPLRIILSFAYFSSFSFKIHSTTVNFQSFWLHCTKNINYAITELTKHRYVLDDSQHWSGLDLTHLVSLKCFGVGTGSTKPLSAFQTDFLRQQPVWLSGQNCTTKWRGRIILWHFWPLIEKEDEQMEFCATATSQNLCYKCFHSAGI